MSTDPTPPRPPVDPMMRRILAFFAVIAAVLVAVVTVSLLNLNRSIATNDWVNHTHALITEIDALQPTLVAAEGALSQYLLTGDPHDREHYRDNFSELGERVDVAAALTAGSPSESQAFATIAELLAGRARRAGEISRLKQAGDPAALQEFLSRDEGDGPHELTRLLDKFREHQTDLLSARDRASFQQAETTRWTVLGGLALDLLLLVGAAWLIRDDLAARRRSARLLQSANDQLEIRVRERTAELTETNRRLGIQNLEERWAKQAVQHQNRYNQLIIDSIADAVFVVTKLLKVSRMNPAAVHLTGYEPAELIDHVVGTFLRLVPATGAPATSYDPLARTLTDGHELRHQPVVLTAKGGATRPMHLNLYPLRDGDKVVGGVLILQALPPTTP